MPAVGIALWLPVLQTCLCSAVVFSWPYITNTLGSFKFQGQDLLSGARKGVAWVLLLAAGTLPPHLL